MIPAGWDGKDRGRMSEVRKRMAEGKTEVDWMESFRWDNWMDEIESEKVRGGEDKRDRGGKIGKKV